MRKDTDLFFIRFTIIIVDGISHMFFIACGSRLLKNRKNRKKTNRNFEHTLYHKSKSPSALMGIQYVKIQYPSLKFIGRIQYNIINFVTTNPNPKFSTYLQLFSWNQNDGNDIILMLTLMIVISNYTILLQYGGAIQAIHSDHMYMYAWNHVYSWRLWRLINMEKIGTIC